jgi:hypothetical protein
MAARGFVPSSPPKNKDRHGRVFKETVIMKTAMTIAVVLALLSLICGGMAGVVLFAAFAIPIGVVLGLLTVIFGWK